MSLNELCEKRLAVNCRLEALPSPLTKAILSIVELLGEDLVGLVIFGSWARGHETDASDIDVLAVLDSNKRLSRNLYRQWEKLHDGESNIDVHFVLLPDRSARVSGLWAEVALEGLVIADSSLKLQRYLSHVRQQISLGKLKRKRTHGQNYWVHEPLAQDLEPNSRLSIAY